MYSQTLNNNQQAVPALIKVDDLVPEKQKYIVYSDNNQVYNKILNQTNLMSNNNKFYILQLLQSQQQSGQCHYFMWTRWGRVGVPGQNALTYFNDSLEKAKAAFNQKYNDKIKGYYQQLVFQNQTNNLSAPKHQINFKEPIKLLLQLIFNPLNILQKLKQLRYNNIKMPILKLPKDSIEKSYKILNEVHQTLKFNNQDQQKFSKLSNDFYSIIPFQFGFSKMSQFILSTQPKIKQKVDLLQYLQKAVIIWNMINAKGEQYDYKQQLTKYYEQCSFSINLIQNKINQQQKSQNIIDQNQLFDNLKFYFDGTKGPDNVKIQIQNIFQLKSVEIKEQIKNKKSILLFMKCQSCQLGYYLKKGLKLPNQLIKDELLIYGRGIYLSSRSQEFICQQLQLNKRSFILGIKGSLKNGLQVQQNKNIEDTIKLIKKEKYEYLQIKNEIKVVEQQQQLNEYIYDGIIIPNPKSIKYLNNKYVFYNQRLIEPKFIFQLKQNS